MGRDRLHRENKAERETLSEYRKLSRKKEKVRKPRLPTIPKNPGKTLPFFAPGVK